MLTRDKNCQSVATQERRVFNSHGAVQKFSCSRRATTRKPRRLAKQSVEHQPVKQKYTHTRLRRQNSEATAESAVRRRHANLVQLTGSDSTRDDAQLM